MATMTLEEMKAVIPEADEAATKVFSPYYVLLSLSHFYSFLFLSQSPQCSFFLSEGDFLVVGLPSLRGEERDHRRYLAIAGG